MEKQRVERIWEVGGRGRPWEGKLGEGHAWETGTMEESSRGERGREAEERERKGSVLFNLGGL